MTFGWQTAELNQRTFVFNHHSWAKLMIQSHDGASNSEQSGCIPRADIFGDHITVVLLPVTFFPARLSGTNQVLLEASETFLRTLARFRADVIQQLCEDIQQYNSAWKPPCSSVVKFFSSCCWGGKEKWWRWEGEGSPEPSTWAQDTSGLPVMRNVIRSIPGSQHLLQGTSLPPPWAGP